MGRRKKHLAGQLALEGMGVSDIAPPEPRPPSDVVFEVFWSLYPRKVGKWMARKTWDKLMKDPHVRAEDIVNGLRAQLDAYSNTSLAFTPHPGSWLHRRRWMDRPEHITPPRELSESEKLQRMLHDRWKREGRI